MKKFDKTPDGLNFIVPIEDARTMKIEYNKLYKEKKNRDVPFLGLLMDTPFGIVGDMSVKYCDKFSGFEFEVLPKSDYYLISIKDEFIIVATIGDVTIDGFVNTINLFTNSLKYGMGHQVNRKVSELKPLTREEFESLVLECFVANKKELRDKEKKNNKISN